MGRGKMGRFVRGSPGEVVELGVGVGRTRRLVLKRGEEVKSGRRGEPETFSVA